MQLVTHALTLHRPWAWAIFHGGKAVENRSWKPPRAHIGKRIAIHAGKVYDRHAAELVALMLDLDGLPAAAEAEGVIGTALLVGVVGDGMRLIEGTGGTLTPLDIEPWFSGPFGWLLDDRRPLAQPILCSGAQGVWRLPTPIEVAA